MYCDKCGTENDDDSKFCIKCGSSTSPSKSSVNKTGKIGINFKNIKIPKTAFIIFGLLIVLVAVIVYIPNVNNKDDHDNLEGLLSDQDSQDNIQKDVQNLKTDNTVKVSIDSIPTGANIYIDNMFRGNAPKIISLIEGNYSLKINMTGYKSIRTGINITSDMTRQDITATLEPIN